MTIRVALAGSLLAAALAGCTQDSGAALTQGLGGVLGGALGGYGGSQLGSGTGQLALTAAGSGLGGLFGGLLGGQLGSGFGGASAAGADPYRSDPGGASWAAESDGFHVEQAQATASGLPLGGTVSWSNPETGSRGSVTPIRDGTSAVGHYCRQFEDRRSADGRTRTSILVACQQPDGRWYGVN